MNMAISLWYCSGGGKVDDNNDDGDDDDDDDDDDDNDDDEGVEEEEENERDICKCWQATKWEPQELAKKGIETLCSFIKPHYG